MVVTKTIRTVVFPLIDQVSKEVYDLVRHGGLGFNVCNELHDAFDLVEISL